MRLVPKRHGFTLVELLVVIGIIAVLISILLPSLAAARRSASSVSCMANLRTIGQGLLLYQNNNGYLPWGECRDPAGGLFAFQTWANAVSAEVGVPSDPRGTQWTNMSLNRVLQCPGALVTFSQGDGVLYGASFQGRSHPLCHYTANFRAMPIGWNPGWMSNDPYTPNYDLYHRRKLESIQDGTNVAIVWDGAQVEFCGGAASGGMPLAWSSVATSFFGHDAMGDGGGIYGVYDENSGIDYNQLLAIGMSLQSVPGYASNTNEIYNVDPAQGYGNSGIVASVWDLNADRDVCIWRYRHGQNNQINMLFADGHVESKRLGEVRLRTVCMNWR